MKSAIIGALLVLALPLLGGCSALRLGYANGPQLAWWWLDGYVDFSREQAPAARQAIDRWFDWHRATQLPGYVAALASLREPVMAPTTAAQVCGWNDRLRQLVDPALDRALQDMAAFVPGLGEPQLRAIEKRFAKSVDQLREDHLQASADDRLRTSTQRAVDRAERLYGGLDDAQQRLVANAVAASPFDPALWLQERQRRQRDTLQTLRRLVADKADRETSTSALRTLLQRSERSPDAVYRDYQRRLTAYNCDFAARIHNATTPAQREHARRTLQGWEEDFRELTAPAG